MGKKRQSAVRTTISVPADLKKQMDLVTEEVNWSALACRAFQDKLTEIQAKKDGKKMAVNTKSIVERLRKSKESGAGEPYQLGVARGLWWAGQNGSAEYFQLQSLANWVDAPRNYKVAVLHKGAQTDTRPATWEDDFKASLSGHETTPGRRLLEVSRVIVAATGERDFRIAWKQVVGEWVGNGQASTAYENEADFVIGFVEGALRIWREVEDQL